jgi:OOP family OmpA-OmpF porin
MKSLCRLPVILWLGLSLTLVAPLTVSAEMVKKVDNFIVFLDQSGSMAQAKAAAGQQKLDRAIAAVGRFDQQVPNLGYTSAVATFASYKMVSAPTPYSKGAVGAAAAGIVPPFNHMTTMGDGLANLDPVIAGLSGKTALIVLTDGEANKGSDPLAEARNLYGKYAPNLCIHVVSYADTPLGQQTIDAIRALDGCSVVADGKTLEGDAAMAKFVKDVLYDDVAPAPAPAPKPVAAAPKPVVSKEVITFNLLFDFDKSEIRDDMVPQLEQARAILMEDPSSSFAVAGYTDSSGPESYNQGLSERRAASVKSWLVDHGIAASRLNTVGYGENRPKYDNATREGRKLNRRVELRSR